jgi:hypothetical protein
VTVYACPRCRKALSFRGRDEAISGVDGHWYACSHCGRELCSECGVQRGRRCDRCEGTFEYDRLFPWLIIADGDWRDFLPRVDAEHGLMLDNENLIAYASPDRVGELLDAIVPEVAEPFWSQVLAYEVERRLGILDGVEHFGSRPLRFDDEWRAGLARIAAAGLAGRSGFDERALLLRVRLDGWRMLDGPVAAILADLDAALDDGRAWLVDSALRCIVNLGPSQAELTTLLARRLASQQRHERALGLCAVMSVRTGTVWRALGWGVAATAFELFVDALSGPDARLVERVIALARPRGRGQSGIASLWAELELGDTLVEQLSDALDPGDRSFERNIAELAVLLSSDHPLFDTIARAIAEGQRPRNKLARLVWALADARNPRYADTFIALLDQDRYGVPALAGLLRLGAQLPESVRAVVQARLDAPGDPSWRHWTVRELPDDLRRSWISDAALFERMTEEAAALDVLAQPLDRLLAVPPRHRTELLRRRPKLLLELQLRLARTNDATSRAAVMTVLGCFRCELGDASAALLIEYFEAPAEPIESRLAAARALSQRPLAEPQRQRLVSTITDPRPLVRAWALRLVDDQVQWAIAACDDSEIVLQLVTSR